MTAFDDRPTPVSAVGAVALSVASLAVLVPFSPPALVVGVPATFVLAGGTVVGRRGVLDLGAAGLLLALLFGAIAPPRPPAAALLVAATLLVASWDAGGNAIEIGRQLGRDADTITLEVMRLGVSLGIGLAAAGIGYGIFQTAASGQPASAVALLLLAFVALTWALRVR